MLTPPAANLEMPPRSGCSAVTELDYSNLHAHTQHPVEFFAAVQTKLACPALNGRPTCPADEISFRFDVNK
jgi:hypothetical protein